MMTIVRTALLVVSLALGFSPVVSGAENDATPTAQSSTAKTLPDVCDNVLHIKDVELDGLIKALEHIKKCAPSEEAGRKLEVYVSGPGGAVTDALFFFDSMRTSGLSARVRFRAAGFIASSSNIVWLAADERIVMPGSQFLIHELMFGAGQGDVEGMVEMKTQDIQTNTNAVLLAAGKEAAELWRACASDKHPATVFGASKALEIGWATKLEGYK